MFKCLQVEDDEARLDRVKQLASLLDDLDASAKSSRIRTSELLHSRSLSSSPPASPPQRESQQFTLPSQIPIRGLSRRDLSDIHEHSDDDLLSDLDEMINNVPSDEEADPTMSPAPPVQSTPYIRGGGSERSKNKSTAREIFQQDDISPVRGLKGAQKTPVATKTPAKTVDFKDPGVASSPATLLIIVPSSKADTRIRCSLPNRKKTLLPQKILRSISPRTNPSTTPLKPLTTHGPQPPTTHSPSITNARRFT